MNGIIIANTGIFNNLTVTGASIFEGPVTITDTTQSFACDEGALIVEGGVGIMGNLNVCGAITATGGISFTGPLIILDHTQSLNCSGGALAVPNGGVGIGGNLNVCGTGMFGSPVIITSTATGSSCSEGALVVFGDVGIEGSLNVCQVITAGGARNIPFHGEEDVSLSRAIPCTGPRNALVLEALGNVGILDNLYVCGNQEVGGSVSIGSATNSTLCTNGALTVSGGAGIGGNLNVCGTGSFNNLTVNNLTVTGPINISDTTQSTACTNGALTVSGGVGIGGNLNVCGTGTFNNAVVTYSTQVNNLNVTGSISGSLVGTPMLATYAGALSTPAATVAAVQGLGANSYFYLIETTTDWTNFQAFLPLAAAAGINKVIAYLIPPSEGVPEPFGSNYVLWAQQIAALAPSNPNLIGMAMDDFAANLSTFTPAYVAEIDAQLNPAGLGFYPVLYFTNITSSLLSAYAGEFAGIIFPFRDDPNRNTTVLTSLPGQIETIHSLTGDTIPLIVMIYAAQLSGTPAPPTTAYTQQGLNLGLQYFNFAQNIGVVAYKTPLTNSSPMYLAVQSTFTEANANYAALEQVKFYRQLLTGYSDTGITRSWTIDSTSGDALFTGTLDGQTLLVHGYQGIAMTPDGDSIFIGNDAGALFTGTNSIAIGVGALEYAVGSNTNLAIGNLAMQNASGGSTNVAMGNGAMEFAVSSSSNVAIGNTAMANEVVQIMWLLVLMYAKCQSIQYKCCHWV